MESSSHSSISLLELWSLEHFNKCHRSAISDVQLRVTNGTHRNGLLVKASTAPVVAADTIKAVIKLTRPIKPFQSLARNHHDYSLAIWLKLNRYLIEIKSRASLRRIISSCRRNLTSNCWWTINLFNLINKSGHRSGKGTEQRHGGYHKTDWLINFYGFHINVRPSMFFCFQ